jgi:hypothetical protein
MDLAQAIQNFPEDQAEVVDRIVDDMILRLDAVSSRTSMPDHALLQVVAARLLILVLQRGECRTNVLRCLEANLEGECPCEMETQGNA